METSVFIKKFHENINQNKICVRYVLVKKKKKKKKNLTWLFFPSCYSKQTIIF